MTKDEFKILVVDDEVLISYHIQEILTSSDFSNIKMVHNKKNAIIEIESFKPNLILLDIRMENEQTGIEIGNWIKENNKIPFIYLTAHSDSNLMNLAFETNPFSYLTKPIKKADLFAAVMLAFKSNQQIPDYFFIKDGSAEIKILINDFLFASSEDNYLAINTKSKKYLVRSSLEKFKIDFPFSEIIQTHRAFLVNKKHIQKIESTFLLLDGIQIPLTRKFKEELRNLVLKS